MSQLDQAATKELDRVEFDPARELVRIRASQLNGCAYCIDMHTKDARAIGESEQRIYALPAWRRRRSSTPASGGARVHRVGHAAGVDHVPTEAYEAVAASSAPMRSRRWSVWSSRSTPGTPSP